MTPSVNVYAELAATLVGKKVKCVVFSMLILSELGDLHVLIQSLLGCRIAPSNGKFWLRHFILLCWFTSIIQNQSKYIYAIHMKYCILFDLRRLTHNSI